MHDQTATTSPTDSDAEALATAVRAFIAAPTDGEFDALALAVHRYQYRANPPYRRFADRLGRQAPRSWRDVPAVPAVAFKETVLACAPAERIYLSSGTTAGPERRAQHHVTDVATYRAAVLAGFARAVLPAGERRRFIVAAPERPTHPASSLGEMVTWLREAHDAGGPPSFLGRPGTLDLEGLAAALDETAGGAPVLVVAVTAALLALDDWARVRDRRWRLPPGSLVVDTGGCKGYARDVPRGEILGRYGERLGVVADQVVNEYGMTELCSQLYARGNGPHVAPPWLRTIVCGPGSRRETRAGDVGLLRHVDLANYGSVLAVQTEDLGRVVDGGVELRGRASDAETRGCSLLVT